MDQGAHVSILNRTFVRAEELADELGCASGPLDAFDPLTTDILVNMTSVGMHPDTDAIPIPADQVHDMIVFDGVYNPAETKLLKTAAQAGCTIIPGIEMFINQAAEQFRLWTGIDPDLNLMKEILS